MSGALFGATALSEPGAGSDFSSIRTSAQKVEGGWRLNGEKGWITNAGIADLFITYVQTDASAGWRGIACFLVDARREGFARGEEGLVTPAILWRARDRLLDYQTAKWVWHCIARYGHS